MAWTQLKYTHEEVNSAAKKLVAYDLSPSFDKQLWYLYYDALPIINNWRSSHSFPLNTFRINLDRTSKKIDGDCLTAQRIKRLSSITTKLIRFPNMKLSQMQDIGGCRAIVQSIDNLNKLRDAYGHTQVKHKLVRSDDYVASPKKTGYRGVHLIWRYRSDRSKNYNDMKIEMQLRTNLQHAWATAVETVGTFLHQALKSSIGEQPWLRFFELMGTVIAFKESTNPVPGTPTNVTDLLSELKHYAETLDVVNRLTTFGTALQILEQPDTERADYFLLQIDPGEHRVTVAGFKLRELESASLKYLEVEKAIGKEGGKDAVLVSVDSITALRRAYPNYFADTHVFAGLLIEALREA